MNGTGLISPNTRIRYPDLTKVGPWSIIDDYCYISTRLELGECFHIAPNCSIIGGKESLFKTGCYGGLATGSRAVCRSDDLVNSMGTVLPPHLNHCKGKTVDGDIVLGDYVTIGANCVIMPDVVIPDGVIVGAMSLVPSKFKFESWGIYVGIANKLRRVGSRNKESVLEQYRKIKEWRP